MSKVLGDVWPVGVCFYVGDGPEVKLLADHVHEGVRKAIEQRHAHIDFDLGEPIERDVEALGRAIQSDDRSILHIVAHGDPDGDLEGADEWGDLCVDRRKLSTLIGGHRVHLALVMSCYGAALARQLTEDGAVDVAVGMTVSMPFSVASAFSRGFFDALAAGRTIRQAFADARGVAGLRADDLPDTLHLFEREGSGAADLPMFQPAEFFLLGTPSDEQAIPRLIEALEPRVGFHVDYSLLDESSSRYMGLDAARVLLSRFAQAKVVMLLFEGARDEDAKVAELVARAVHRAVGGEVRLFPVYLRGTTPNPNLPFGMFRLVPAYLEKFGDSYARLGAALQKLVR